MEINKKTDNIKLWQDTPTLFFDKSIDQPEPYLVPFIPAKADKPLTAVIVCPGGSYNEKAEHEGDEVSECLCRSGIAAFTLQYRVTPYHHPVPLLDAQRAIRTVRHLAPQLGINPERIGIMGFSAGGHLAACASVLFDENFSAPCDEIDSLSARPDFACLAYPVTELVAPYYHKWSAVSLLGENPDQAVIDQLTLGAHITERTPPMFIWHTFDDKCVPVQNSLNFAKALADHGAKCEMHIFPYGPHGLGLAEDRVDIREWKDLFLKWLGKI